MLSVKDLTKSYGDIVAVDSISFEVEKGQIFGLLGPNGAGKTTTMRMILNIINPTSGKIIFNREKSLSNFYDIVGYLPEERGLYKKSRVIDLILYFASLKGMKRSFAKIEAKKWLSKLEISDLAVRKIGELSKGNQQKVQFICSIIHNPEILIFDEPFTSLDPINQQEIKNLILEFANNGKIIILSTHQMDIAEKLCAKIFLINKGKEVCSGLLSDIKGKFGSNNIKLGIDGDCNFLKSSSDVLSYEIYSNYCEVQLKESVNPTEFLKMIIDKKTITHFSIIQPSLNKIFLDLVKNFPGKSE